jgi:predicted amidohydrolase YtcJ
VKIWRALGLVPLVCVSLFGQPQPADIAIINANIRTMAEKMPRAEAVAIRDGRIVAVGTDLDIRPYIAKTTRIIDAAGQLVLPGFNDSHVHFIGIGNRFSSIDLSEAGSAEEMRSRFADYARFLPKGRWILGSRWGHEKWPGKALPTRQLIDPVTPDTPVFVYAADPKVALVNTRALVLAGLIGDRTDGGTGEPLDEIGLGIDRDRNGEPTGIIRDKAVEFVRRFVPSDHSRNWAEIAETASNYAVSYGITSVQDTDSDEHAELYRELWQRGRLKVRIYDCHGLPNWKRFSDAKLKAATGDAGVRNGCLKGHSDGDPDSKESLARNVAAADKAGLQVLLHAIGQVPNRFVLDAIEGAAKDNGGDDRRFRIEHAQNASREDIARMSRLGVVGSVQPHLFGGRSGSGGSYYKLFSDAGVRLAFGSDAPITGLDPMLGIAAAVKGDPRNSLSVEDAIRAYTLGSAFAEFQEKEKGTIEVGKAGDFVILSIDILGIEQNKIPSARVVMTIIDGRIVYKAN